MQTSSLQPGAILNSPTQQYRIVEVLGAGSFGITYLASSKVKYGNVSFNVKFAIKEHFMDSCYRDKDGVRVHCTPTSRNSVEQSRNDFLNEAKRLQNLCNFSRNIVHVNEAFEANGTAYYVMEYLDGGSPGKMGEREALHYIQQIAAAVKILHEHKLLHLDIKPDNIVLKREDTGTIYPVLIDFGITKHFDEKGNPTSSPNAKGISLGYAPIEQNDVIREFAPTLDIYALGATLLYLLTGKNPPSSVKLIDSSQKELNSLIPANVSKSTRAAILKAMKPNKNERTQTVSSFLKDLHVLNDSKVRSDASGATSASVNDETYHHTKPINNKQKNGYTEPIKKKRSNSEADDESKWFCPSRIVMIVSFILSLVGLGFYNSSLLLNGVWCLLGLGASLALSHFIGKWTKAKSGIVFCIELFLFVFICSFLGSTIILWITLAVFMLSLALPLAFISDNKLIRWGTSVALLCVSAFFGYVWYSQNILHNICNESNDPNIIEQTKITTTDSEIYSDAGEMQRKNDHSYVDLGLPSGIKWATCNIGATAPEKYGNYYSWGETSTKDNYDILNSITYKKNIAELQSMNVINTYGNLSMKYDAASVNWGSNWRIPTVEDFKELKDNCTWDWTYQKGIIGFRVTGKNGCSIFLPAAGYRDENQLYHVGDGSYWSATASKDNEEAYAIYFYGEHYSIDSIYDRFCGRSIRPVID